MASIPEKPLKHKEVAAILETTFLAGVTVLTFKRISIGVFVASLLYIGHAAWPSVKEAYQIHHHIRTWSVVGSMQRNADMETYIKGDIEHDHLALNYRDLVIDRKGEAGPLYIQTTHLLQAKLTDNIRLEMPAWLASDTFNWFHTED